MPDFRKSLFGYNTRDVAGELYRLDAEQQKQIAEMQAEIQANKDRTSRAEQEAEELKRQIKKFEENELMISQALITAQKNGQKIEAEARENARLLMDKCNEELRVKEQELASLRVKVTKFKDDFREILDNYRYSIENLKEPSVENNIPTLVRKEKSLPAAKGEV